MADTAVSRVLSRDFITVSTILLWKVSRSVKATSFAQLISSILSSLSAMAVIAISRGLSTTSAAASLISEVMVGFDVVVGERTEFSKVK